MDGKDFFPFFLIGQCHIEDFIETAFPQQFRRHIGDVIGRGHDKGLTVFFLQPRKERSEQTGRHVRCPAAAADAGKSLFQFIDPEHTWRNGFGQADGLAHIGFRFTDIFAHEASHVKAQQGNAEEFGRRLGIEGFATAGHAGNEDAFGHIDAKGRSGLHIAENLFLSLEPLFQTFQSANIVHAFFEGNHFQYARFLYDLFFLFQYER